MEEAQYESIKAKLRKLQALAERGSAGEAENARRLFNRLCEQYNITLEQISEEKTEYYYFDVGRSKLNLSLFVACYCKLLNVSTMGYKQMTRSRIAVELTALQNAELRNLFEWHKELFKKEFEKMQETFELAYFSKHKLHSDGSSRDNDDDCELTAEDLRKLQAIMSMKNEMSDEHYQKRLQQS